MKNLKNRLVGIISAMTLIFGIVFVTTGCGSATAPVVPQVFVVTYSLGEGVSGTAPTDANLYLTGQTVKLAAAPSREGYKFTAWNDGSKNYDAESSYTMGIANATNLRSI